MSTLRSAVTLLLLAAWLGLAAAPFCQAAAEDVMPCCKKAGPCAEGLGRPGCCRVAPGASTPRAAADALPGAKQKPVGPVLAAAAPTATPAALPAALTEWATRPAADHGAVPIYLLNASILR